MMEDRYNTPHEISAYQAKFEALKISFAPVIFQVTVSLVQLGVLNHLNKKGQEGADVSELAKEANVSEYGVSVLLDAALSARIVWKKDEHYIIDKIGIMLVSDEMVKVNVDFINDVCYQGLFHLPEAIKAQKPAGLKVFGDWPTIYPALSSLPEKAKKSWFAFDHYYSDKSFKELLEIVFSRPIKSLLDVGGNTGKWAKQCMQHDENVHITIADLPPQTKLAWQNMSQHNLTKRFSSCDIDLLDQHSTLPTGHDVIWMSQFLDCFSKVQVLQILKKAVAAMSEDTQLYILDLFWDRQAFEPAAYAINCTSIYFTSMANGNSRMYHSKEFIKLITQAGLKLVSQQDMIGPGHTLLICEKI